MTLHLLCYTGPLTSPQMPRLVGKGPFYLNRNILAVLSVVLLFYMIKGQKMTVCRFLEPLLKQLLALMLVQLSTSRRPWPRKWTKDYFDWKWTKDYFDYEVLKTLTNFDGSLQDPALKNLMELGFPRIKCIAALRKAKGSLDEACNILLHE